MPLLDVGFHDFGHAAQEAVVQEESVVLVHFQLGKRGEALHMGEHVCGETFSIALCPKKLLKVHGGHLKVFLVADTVALDPAIVQSQHGAAQDDVVVSFELEKLQTGCDVRKFLDFIKNEKRLVWNQRYLWREDGNIAENVFFAVAVR